MTKIQITNERVFGYLELVLVIYLGFGFRNLGFQAYAVHRRFSHSFEIQPGHQ